MKPLSFSSRTMFSRGSPTRSLAALFISMSSLGVFPIHLENLDRKSLYRLLVPSERLASCFKLNLSPLDMNRGDRPSGEAKGSRIPEKAEITKMVNAARSRTYRTAILLLKDSGLRVSDAVRLKWDDVEDLGDGFWGWSKIMTRKRRIMATPFVGPEATDALKQLDRDGEKIFPVSAKTLSNAILLTAKRSKVKGVSAHGLRKFFNVELEAARVPREWRYQMMGKKTGAYDEKRMSKLFEAYRDAYDHLRVFGVSGSMAEVEALKRSVDRQETERQILLDRVNLLEKQTVTQREEIVGMKREIRNLETGLLDFEKALRFSMRERKT